MNTGVLLLAAGRGRRFGSDKRFARLADGSTLLAATIQRVRSSGLPLRVALRKDDAAAAAVLAAQAVTAVRCHSSHAGMGATLAEAIAQVRDWDATLVALADMPWITAATFTTVARAASRDTIVIPVHAGQRGHPVAFGVRFHPELGKLAGDVGARPVVQRHSGRVLEVAVDDPGIVRDVDHPRDIPSG